MTYDAVVVGGGIAGLTASAYLARAGVSTLLLEASSRLGGLVSTFEKGGFHYDGGIRALEDSGALLPMLRQLGLELDLRPNQIAVGIGDQVIRITSPESLEDYRQLLEAFFPDDREAIARVTDQIREIMRLMEVQYAIKNPAFLDVRADRDYFIREIFPWMFRYAVTVPRINAFNGPVEDFLRRFTGNQALIDIIAQHFFRATPAFFALSYLSLYLDYRYPAGGTGALVAALEGSLRSSGGEIRLDSRVTAVDPANRLLSLADGEMVSYRGLIWAADQKTFYRQLDLSAVDNPAIIQRVADRQALISDKRGNDSVFTLFLAVDRDPAFFRAVGSEHFFYTPTVAGESSAGPAPLDRDWSALQRWLRAFFAATTFEISIPCLRDPALAPAGKTGLVISALFDIEVARRARDLGVYDEFKTFCEDCILEVLSGSVYAGIASEVLDRFSSSPLTMERLSGNTDGAITGWAFTNDPLPAESRIPRIAAAVKTPIPGIFQAGQWTYSPSGLPISLITGKMAADAALKAIRKAR